jgi:hypothetical protein
VPDIQARVLQGYTLYAYATVQVWAQAAEKAGSLEIQAMIAALRQHQFDSVLGPIAFDEKGDLAVCDQSSLSLTSRPTLHVRNDSPSSPRERNCSSRSDSSTLLEQLPQC